MRPTPVVQPRYRWSPTRASWAVAQHLAVALLLVCAGLFGGASASAAGVVSTRLLASALSNERPSLGALHGSLLADVEGSAALDFEQEELEADFVALDLLPRLGNVRCWTVADPAEAAQLASTRVCQAADARGPPV